MVNGKKSLSPILHFLGLTVLWIFRQKIRPSLTCYQVWLVRCYSQGTFFLLSFSFFISTPIKLLGLNNNIKRLVGLILGAFHSVKILRALDSNDAQWADNPTV